jgi:hypothetical protein
MGKTVQSCLMRTTSYNWRTALPFSVCMCLPLSQHVHSPSCISSFASSLSKSLYSPLYITLFLLSLYPYFLLLFNHFFLSPTFFSSQNWSLALRRIRTYVAVHIRDDKSTTIYRANSDILIKSLN